MGGGESSGKIAWIKWRAVCKSESLGRLGVRDVELFNVALLSKWDRRYLNEKNNLWARVVESRYGVGRVSGSVFEVREGMSRWSGWWRDIVISSFGGEGDWFKRKLERVLGDGMSTDFWFDSWAGEESLKLKFLRLFQLSLDVGSRIGEMGVWEEGLWAWKWRWRRPLRDRDMESFNALISLINRFPVRQGVGDSWRWTGSANGGYFSKDAYDILINQQQSTRADPEKKLAFNLIWKSFAPLKVRLHLLTAVMRCFLRRALGDALAAGVADFHQDTQSSEMKDRIFDEFIKSLCGVPKDPSYMFTDKEYRGPFSFSEELSNLSIGPEPSDAVVVIIQEVF
ncbi:hypothetical protein OROMI_004966 [Orobanche minor]